MKYRVMEESIAKLGLPSDNDSACALPQGADDGAMKFMVAMVACVMLTAPAGG